MMNNEIRKIPFNIIKTETSVIDRYRYCYERQTKEV